jgi:uncharacterized protein YceK
VCGAHSINSDHDLERESNNALEKYLALRAKTLKANVRIKKMMKIICMLIAASCLACCGTIKTLVAHPRETDYHHSVFGGVREDAACIQHARRGPAGALILIPIVDLPFSLVADTVVLPYTGTRAILKDKDEDSNKTGGR